MTEFKRKETLKEKKEDGKEFLELLKRVPKEKRERILGIVEGMAIQAESEKKAG